MRHLLLGVLALALAACSSSGPDEPPSTPTVAGSGTYKVGKPYKVSGRWYYPKTDPSYDRIGTASWYGEDFHGLKTANGEIFDMNRVSAAHPTLPLPSLVRVTNMENGRSIVLRVNDRGPFVDDRLIDLSQAAARELGYERNGLAKVRVQFVQIADDAAAPVTAKAQRRVAPRPPVVAEPEPVIAAASAPVTTVSAPVQVAAARQEAVIVPRTAPAALPSCAAGGWVVQVGAFADAASVRAVASQVSTLERVRVEPAFANGRAVARVRLGPLASRDRAGMLLGEVKALGHDQAFVTCGAAAPGLGVG
ncbi:MAG TPA: septal ring lytic transglycosylase RlpA family protein [Geminicoccaceae bacterium]|nr:septal ring lytic transglycosylase RlpA family protein [Geminicoccaceae bacterium]